MQHAAADSIFVFATGATGVRRQLPADFNFKVYTQWLLMLVCILMSLAPAYIKYRLQADNKHECIYIYICKHVYVYVYIYIYIYTHMRICLSLCVYIYIYIHMYTHTMHIMRVYIYTCVYIFVHITIILTIILIMNIVIIISIIIVARKETSAALVSAFLPPSSRQCAEYCLFVHCFVVCLI